MKTINSRLVTAILALLLTLSITFHSKTILGSTNPFVEGQVWNGEYSCGPKVTPFKLIIDDTQNNYVKALFLFSLIENPSSSKDYNLFEMEGMFLQSEKFLHLKGGSKIKRAKSFNAIDLVGNYDPTTSSYAGGTNCNGKFSTRLAGEINNYQGHEKAISEALLITNDNIIPLSYYQALDYANERIAKWKFVTANIKEVKDILAEYPIKPGLIECIEDAIKNKRYQLVISDVDQCRNSFNSQLTINRALKAESIMRQQPDSTYPAENLRDQKKASKLHTKTAEQADAEAQWKFILISIATVAYLLVCNESSYYWKRFNQAAVEKYKIKSPLSLDKSAIFGSSILFIPPFLVGQARLQFGMDAGLAVIIALFVLSMVIVSAVLIKQMNLRSAIITIILLLAAYPIAMLRLMPKFAFYFLLMLLGGGSKPSRKKSTYDYMGERIEADRKYSNAMDQYYIQKEAYNRGASSDDPYQPNRSNY